MKLKVKLTDGAELPRHAKEGDAGLDLTSRDTVTLSAGETKVVGTGVAIELPKGYVGLVFPRSGLGSRGVNLSNCVGVIDSGYRGEIKAPLHSNRRDEDMTIERGDRVCQLVVMPYVSCECVEVENLSDSVRGASGFGSSDVKGDAK